MKNRRLVKWDSRVKYSDARHASENPMRRKQCEAGGRQPETTTGFEYKTRSEQSLFGSLRIAR